MNRTAIRQLEGAQALQLAAQGAGKDENRHFLKKMLNKFAGTCDTEMTVVQAKRFNVSRMTIYRYTTKS
ncbi:helix-turn-helix domain-containing protein [Escherichia coli]|uniref:helix-turn-helix domain-containing protein n=1 Tax=Escherichia coli TaxID=562 RepID=UPI003D97B69F